MIQFASDVAFTPAVKEIQAEKGSRTAYAKVEQGRGWQTEVTPELTAFLSGLDRVSSKSPYITRMGNLRVCTSLW